MEVANNKAEVYDRTTITLHWITAVSVVLLWISGQTADWIPDGPVHTAYWSAHLLLGFTFAVVLACRITWRASRGRRLPAADPGLLQAFAKATHYLLYALLLTVVSLGIVNAFVRGYDLFGLVKLPQLGELAWRRPITDWHGLAANLVLGLALLHAAAALVHRYLWHDGVLGRMLPTKAMSARDGNAASERPG